MRFTNSTLTLAGILVLVMTAFSGCLTASASSSAALYVKDAPSDEFSHLYVSFTKAQVHQVLHADKEIDDDEDETEEGDQNETDDDRDDMNKTSDDEEGEFGEESEAGEDHGQHDEQDRAEGKWITILDHNVTVDLMAFSGNASAFLDSAKIPAGKYNGIRLTVSSATATLLNNSTVDVKVPSGALRIKGHFTVVDGQETNLTIDFILDRSVHETGNGGYMLKPVVRLASEHHDEPREHERSEREARRDAHDRESHEAMDD